MSAVPARSVLVTLLAMSAAGLAAHAAQYSFLTDDAFISFRYAENLAAGHGLVFNPGQERVEGYSNFLWVVLLAGARVVGIEPEHAALAFGWLATALLWGVIVRFEWRRREHGPLWVVAVAPLLLAATRSVAVWTTSGLETRFFELLVVAGTLGAAEWIGDERRRGTTPWALLLALSALTRPDGMLVGGSVIVATWVAAPARRRMSVVRAGVLFAAIVAAHFVGRLVYYGEWLPNTYYAKIGGATWWWMGVAYFGSWILEYAAFLWIAPIALALRATRSRGAATTVPLLFGAAMIPHAIYVASIGGDHFEFRPLDLYFPFVYLLVADGVRELARQRVWIAVLSTAILLAGVWAIPSETHRQFPDAYRTGFPGRFQDRVAGREFLAPASRPWIRWPLVSSLVEAYRSLLVRTTRHFVGIRAEEHASFLHRIAVPEARRLRALVDAGVIARDAYIAMDCVGVIPYMSGLLVLDRLGLNDAHVARGESARGVRRLAHEKRADLAYARERGVHFWTLDPVRVAFRPHEPEFRFHLSRARELDQPALVGETDDGHVLIGFATAGPESLVHLPGVRFLPVSDPAVAQRYGLP